MILPLSLSRPITTAIVCGLLVCAYFIPGQWVNRLSENGFTSYLYAGICIYQGFVNDLLTPRLSFSELQSMLVSEEEAQSKIGEVQFLDDMVLGNVIYVQLKNESKQRRVMIAEGQGRQIYDAVEKSGFGHLLDFLATSSVILQPCQTAH